MKWLKALKRQIKTPQPSALPTMADFLAATRQEINAQIALDTNLVQAPAPTRVA